MFFPEFNNGYPWISKDGLYFKGFLFDSQGRFYQGQEALQWFRQTKDPDGLANILKDADGSFTVVIHTETGILVGVDVMSMFPVFYTQAKGSWMVSDSSEKLVSGPAAPQINDDALSEFRAGGFVLGRETLLKGIFRLKPGECVFLGKDGSMQALTYHYFLPPALDDKFPSRSEGSLMEVLDKLTRKLLNSLNGETLVVPLSGGYDSRLIACLLKRAGFEKVICFTYGRPNPEASISRKVARQLGFQWIFVNYEDLKAGNYTSDPVFEAYCRYSGNNVSMPYLQEYFGVKHLKDNHLIPHNSIFLPGHSGDFLGGSYVDKTANFRAGEKSLPAHIAENYFWFLPLSRCNKQAITLRLQDWFSLYTPPPSATKPGYCAFIEDWDVKEKLAKFIFNSALVFPYFGYGIRFPLWDRLLRDYFRNLPFTQRSQKVFYDSVLENHLFKPMGVYFGSEELTFPGRAKTHSHFRPATGRLPSLKRTIKKTAKRMLPFALLQRKMKRNDWIHYAAFTRIMRAEIKAKGRKAPARYNSYNALICEWYIGKLTQ